MSTSRASERASQETTLERLVEEFCEQLTQGTVKRDEIQIRKNTLESLAEALRSIEVGVVQVKPINDILVVLEHPENDVCDRLGAATFGTIFEIVLRAKYCREGEKIHAILSQILHEARITLTKKTFNNKLLNIAKNLRVVEILKYFTIIQNPNAFRRWVGIFLLQLLRGPEKIYNEFRHAPEDVRRRLGPMTVEETDEILRMMCGRIVKALLDSDIAAEDLWPVEAIAEEYDNFPTNSQSQNAWKNLFQNWVDEKWQESQEPVQTLYYNHSIITKPHHRIGTPGNNMEMVFEEDCITVSAASIQDDPDQIVEIIYSSVQKIKLQNTHISQVLNVFIEFRDQEPSCYINCKPIVLEQLRMAIDEDAKSFVTELHSRCEGAEYLDQQLQVSVAENAFSVQGELESELTSPESANEGQEGVANLRRANTELSPTSPCENPEDLEFIEESQRIDSEEASPTIPVQSMLIKQPVEHRSDIPDFSDSITVEVIQVNNESLQLPSEDERPTKSYARPLTQDIKSSIQKTSQTGTKNIGEATSTLPKQKFVSKNVGEQTSFPTTKTTKYHALKPKTPIATPKVAKDAILVKPLAARTSIYDMPEDEDENFIEQTSKAAKEVKKNSQGSKSIGKAAGKNSTKKTKPEPKKRKLDANATKHEEAKVAARSSQREAASQAKLKMRNLDTLDDDELSDEKDIGPAQPNVSRKRKLVAEPLPSAIFEADEPVAEHQSDQDNQVFGLPEEDVQRPGSTQNFLPEASDADDLYTASPIRKPAVRPSSDQEYPSSQSRKAAAINFAGKMTIILSSDPELGDTSSSDLEVEQGNQDKENSAPQRTSKKSKQNLTEDKPTCLMPHAHGQGRNKVQSIKEEYSQDNGAKRQSQEKTVKVDQERFANQHPEEIEKVGGGENSKKEKRTAEKRIKQAESQLQQKETSDNTNLTVTSKRISKKHNNDIKDAIRIPNPQEAVLQLENLSHTQPATNSLQQQKQQYSERMAINNEIALTGQELERDPTPVSKTIGENLGEERKRKVDTGTNIPPKRQRPDVSAQSDDPTLPKQSHRNKIDKSLEKPENRGGTLLDDKIIRKPHLIHFGPKGPQNQGFSSTEKPSTTPRTSKLVVGNSEKEKLTAPLEKKRRRREINHSDEEDSLFVSDSPPSKRQSISPSPLLNHATNGPNVPILSQSSSQALRVDPNGSPIAQKSRVTDRISNIEQKLNLRELNEATSQSLELQQGIPSTTIPATDGSFAQDTPEIFGPRFKLASIAKARPAPPGDLPVRYIPHTKTKHGYEAILSMENIQEGNMPDPFLENIDRKSSCFTKLLRAGSLLTKGFDSKNKENANLVDPDKTLVEMERETPSSPDDLTSGTSYQSGNESASRAHTEGLSLERKWSLAVRPHYEAYAEAVHRVADEMVIRLASEEDASMLIVNQYRGNGTKILNGLANERDNEKREIQRALNKKRSDMVQMCSEASRFMTKTQENLTTSSLVGFEQEWRKRQEKIRKQIAGGRRVSND